MASEEEIEQRVRDALTALSDAEDGDEAAEAWGKVLAEVRSQAASLADQQRLIDGLMTDSNNAAAEIAELRQQLEYQTSRASNFKAEKKVLEDEASDAKAELAEAKREAVADHERNVNLGIEIEALRADIAAANDAHKVREHELQREVAALRSDLEKKHAEHAELQKIVRDGFAKCGIKMGESSDG